MRTKWEVQTRILDLKQGVKNARRADIQKNKKTIIKQNQSNRLPKASIKSFKCWTVK